MADRIKTRAPKLTPLEKRLMLDASLPAIAGAVLLELRHGLSVGDLPPGWMWGALAAFLTGYAALRFLRRIVVRGQLRLFAVYCACIGALALGASLAG